MLRDLVLERKDAELERAVCLEALFASREELHTQINRICETRYRVINKDTALGEKVRILFREQSVTITSILTALNSVLPVTSGGAASPTSPPPPPPSDNAGVKEWAKKQLESFGGLLTKLAEKAAAALPGIIGNIVSWLLCFLSKTVSWLGTSGRLWWHWLG